MTAGKTAFAPAPELGQGTALEAVHMSVRIRPGVLDKWRTQWYHVYMSSKINWKRRKYSESEFRNAWNTSLSIAECARKLGLNIYGSTYHTMRDTAEALGLSKEHMTGQGWLRGRSHSYSKKKPLEEVLVQNNRVSSSNLKKRLISEGIIDNKCSAPFCPVPNPTINPFTGEEAELKLALDHINGDNADNRIENLRLLCYHCHGMTDTWCRGHTRNNVSRSRPSGEPVDSKSTSRNYSVAGSTPVSCTCGNINSSRAELCRDCELSSRKGKPKPWQEKIEWPPLETLEKMVSETSYLAVGRELGVSDNAVRKAIRRMKIDLENDS